MYCKAIDPSDFQLCSSLFSFWPHVYYYTKSTKSSPSNTVATKEVYKLDWMAACFLKV